MYKTILIPVDNTPTDRAIIDHIKPLAKLMGSRVIILHIATGVPAQYHGKEAAGQEVEEDNAYLKQLTDEFLAAGIPARSELGFGEPAKEIIKWVGVNNCDLIAMSTHGHKILGDLLLGSTASKVQHAVSIPVLLLRAR